MRCSSQQVIGCYLHTSPTTKKTHTNLATETLPSPKRELSKKLSSKHHFIGAWFLFFWWEVPFSENFIFGARGHLHLPTSTTAYSVIATRLKKHVLNMSLIFPQRLGKPNISNNTTNVSCTPFPPPKKNSLQHPTTRGAMFRQLTSLQRILHVPG